MLQTARSSRTEQSVEVERMADTFEPKIIQLPGTEPSPEVILHRTLTKLSRIRNVVVVIQWDDDSWDADWTPMSKAEFGFCGRILENEIRKEIFGSTPEPREE